MRTRAPLNLYWCSTEDHSEDWFILAPTVQEAQVLHADYEGYEPEDVEAELVCAIPAEVEAKPGWPQAGLIEACGGTILVDEPEPRQVRIGRRTYIEGAIDSVLARANDDIAESRGDGRPNNTINPESI